MDDKKQEAERKEIKNWARFSQMGIQMMATIGLGTWLGVWLDGHFATKNPLFTVVLSLLSIGVSLYNVVRQLPKD
jgi:ATP synthase protein I